MRITMDSTDLRRLVELSMEIAATNGHVSTETADEWAQLLAAAGIDPWEDG